MTHPTSLPIAEHFHSLQGEASWAGTPMHFIRTAGCSVGKPVRHDDPSSEYPFPILKTGAPAWKCHTYDNRPFWCDTDFARREDLSIDDLLDETWERHVCITGGEPFLHTDRLGYLIEECARRDIQVHFETSGTIEWLPVAWICVSPKAGCLPSMIHYADEIKLLVDPQFDLALVPPEVTNHPNVWVQPINDELAVRQSNVQIAMEVLRVRPQWKLSVQLHKFLGLR